MRGLIIGTVLTSIVRLVVLHHRHLKTLARWSDLRWCKSLLSNIVTSYRWARPGVASTTRRAWTTSSMFLWFLWFMMLSAVFSVMWVVLIVVSWVITTSISTMMFAMFMFVTTLVVMAIARSSFVLNYLFCRPSEVYNRRDFLALYLCGFLRWYVHRAFSIK